MRTTKITIPGRLPGLNDLISSARGKPWWMCKNTKKIAMDRVASVFMSVGTPRFIVPVKIKMTFFEPNARRDRDNVSSGGAKIILDAMKHLGVIVDDSRKWVHDIQHDTTKLDRKNPRVEVDIIED